MEPLSSEGGAPDAKINKQQNIQDEPNDHGTQATITYIVCASFEILCQDHSWFQNGVILNDYKQQHKCYLSTITTKNI